MTVDSKKSAFRGSIALVTLKIPSYISASLDGAGGCRPVRQSNQNGAIASGWAVKLLSERA